MSVSLASLSASDSSEKDIDDVQGSLNGCRALTNSLRSEWLQAINRIEELEDEVRRLRAVNSGLDTALQKTHEAMDHLMEERRHGG
jgi:chromosome segregation ATPase